MNSETSFTSTELSGDNPESSEHETSSNSSSKLRTLSDLELVDKCKHIVLLMDLAGHAKYLKTTLQGLIGHRPDHVMVCISATTGILSMTAEHIGLSLYLQIPLVIVITKTDCLAATKTSKDGKKKVKIKKKIGNCYQTAAAAAVTRCDDHKLNADISVEGAVGEVLSTTAADSCCDALMKLVQSITNMLAGLQREAALIENEQQLERHLLLAEQVNIYYHNTVDDACHSNSINIPPPLQSSSPPVSEVPIFLVSNVTGSGLSLLQSYLYKLPSQRHNSTSSRRQCITTTSAAAADKQPVHCSKLIGDLYGSSTNNLPFVRILGSIGNSSVKNSSNNLSSLADPCCSSSNNRIEYLEELPTTTISSTADDAALELDNFIDIVSISSVGTRTSTTALSSDYHLQSGNNNGGASKILIGSIQNGKIGIEDKLLLGPSGSGKFAQVLHAYRLCYI